MRWESLREQPDDGALLNLADVGQQADRGTARAGLTTPESGPIVSGDDTDAVAVEIRARSIINRVPGESAVPFRWTVNPYRGCSHACVYCLAGDTPILMADGTSKPLAELRVGDRIYGTSGGSEPGEGALRQGALRQGALRQGALREGRSLRYTPTTVLAHWSSIKRAYRITLADGTCLVASGDHRFLTASGWKHVTGTMPGGAQRPRLRAGERLFGIGGFAVGAEATQPYRTGYLCGVIRGRALSLTAGYEREDPSSDGSGPCPFGLALGETEAAERVRRYLACFDVRPDGLAFSDEQPQGRELSGISTSSPDTYQAITTLIEWPLTPGEDWYRGFLAGIVDAEGQGWGGEFRIPHAADEVMGMIELGLKHFDFDFTNDFTIDERARGNRVRMMRLAGGLGECMRFVHTVAPAISRELSIDGVAVRDPARLAIHTIEPVGAELTLYDITTGTGDFIANGVVSHNCFARRTHEYLDLDSGRDFDTKIMVKVNAGERLRKELAHPKWGGEPIAMGTNTDPYQRAEGHYRLMPPIIAALRDAANPFSILTKGSLILRDAELIGQAARCTDVGLAVSIGSLDETVWRSVEPGTPRPQSRLDIVRRFADMGLECSVLMAPILPGLTDSPEQIEATVQAVAAAGAANVTPIALHLRPGAREWYFAWLGRQYPELLGYYRDLYQRGAYAPKGYQDALTARVHQAARRYGLMRPESSQDPRQGDAEARHAGQGDAEAEHAGARRAPTEQLTLL